MTCNISKALLVQHINQALLERFMLTSEHASSEVVVPKLTADELSALYSAAGYVPFALRKRFKRRFVTDYRCFTYSDFSDQIFYRFCQGLMPEMMSLEMLPHSMIT